MLNQKVTRLRVRAVSIIFAVVLGLGFAVLAQGQAPDRSPERGFHPGKSYALSEIETISRASGELSLNIPLGSLPSGRGGLSASLRMLYSSKIWDSAGGFDPNSHGTGVESSTLIKSEEGGWRYGFEYLLKLNTRRTPEDETGLSIDECQSFAGYARQLVLVTPDGGRHVLLLEDQYYAAHTTDGYMNIWPDGRAVCAGSTPVTGNISYYTTDGSYLRLDITADTDTNWENNPWRLSLPDGTQVLGGKVPDSPLASQQIIDRNGNFIEIINTYDNASYGDHDTTTIQDEMNRKIVIEYEAATDQDKIHVTGFNGLPLVWTVQWRTITVRKTYYASDLDVTHILGTMFKVVDKITLPIQADSLFYLFDYNACNPADSTCPQFGNNLPSVGWGELSKITLPSGAAATYTYQRNNATGSTIKPFHILRNRPTQKTLSYNAVYDGVTTPVAEQWNYAATYSGNDVSEDDRVLDTTITGPDGGVSKEYLTNGPPQEAFKTENPDGTLTERIYEDNTPHGLPFPPSKNRVLKYEYTSVKNTEGTLTKTAVKEYKYDKNGNNLEVHEYDWASYSSLHAGGTGEPQPPSAVPVRVTQNTYYSDTPEASDSTTNDPDTYSKPTAPLLRNAVKSSEVRNGATPPVIFSRSEYTYDFPTTRGNLTLTKTWDSTKGALPITSTPINFISTSATYHSSGNVLTTTDAKGVQTNFTYDGNDLYPTKIEKASNFASLKLTTEKVYDFSSGLETEVKDFDNDVKTTMTYDALGRTTLVKDADGIQNVERQTETLYSDLNRRVIVRSDLDMTADKKLVSITHYDQLGRVRLNRTLENATTESATNEEHGIKVQTRYKVGNPSSDPYSYTLSSNPYRAAKSNEATNEETMGWSRSKTDNGGRLREIETFSGVNIPAPWSTTPAAISTGKVVTSYDANATTVTDQALKSRKSEVDGLGRLSKIYEAPGSLNHETSYLYDALGNLTQVMQGDQTRTFTYDSLSRLRTAKNPEQVSGSTQIATSYTYDDASNLISKVNPNLTSLTFEYDALNRATKKTLSPGGIWNYTYDTGVSNAKGRLVSVVKHNTTEGTYYGGYDKAGRVQASTQKTTVGAQTYEYTTSYVYNVAGNLTKEVYPSGKEYRTSYDTAGRVAGVSRYLSGNFDKTYASAFAYTPHGAMKAMSLGGTVASPVMQETIGYNSRLQPTKIELKKLSDTSLLLGLDYVYGATNQNNDNVSSQTIRIGATTSIAQNYTYDALNRLSTASESGTGTWSQTYGYDPYGNRWVSGGNIPNPTLTPQSVSDFQQTPSSNRLAASTYDISGNQTVDAGGRTFAYDAENKQTSFNNGAATYGYDADGRRVRKTEGNATTVFVYNAMGQMVAEYTTPDPTPQLGGGTSYLTTDALGSTRVVTGASGEVKSRRDYLPFGEEITSLIPWGVRNSIAGYGANDGQRNRFTSKERDDESGMDYFLARYYSSAQGRFTSPDEFAGGPDEFWVLGSGDEEKQALPYADIFEPQSLNKYQYCLNNPLRYIDPDGHQNKATPASASLAADALKMTAAGGAAAAGSVGVAGGLIIYIIVEKTIGWDTVGEAVKDVAKRHGQSGDICDCPGLAESQKLMEMERQRNNQLTPAQSATNIEMRGNNKSNNPSGGKAGKIPDKTPAQEEKALRPTNNRGKRAKKDRSVGGEQDNQDSLHINQANERKVGRGEAIQGTGRTDTNARTARGRIKSSEHVKKEDDNK